MAYKMQQSFNQKDSGSICKLYFTIIIGLLCEDLPQQAIFKLTGNRFEWR